jgi:hypothetical protein
MGWRDNEDGAETWEGCSRDFFFVVAPTHEECCTKALRELGATSREDLNGTCRAGTEVIPNPLDPEPDNPEPENPEPDNPEPENPESDNPEPENPEPENPEPQPVGGEAGARRNVLPGAEPGPAKPGGAKPEGVPSADRFGRKLQQDSSHTMSALNFSDPGWEDPWLVEPNRQIVDATVTERRFDSNSSYDDMAWAGAWLFKATDQSGKWAMTGGSSMRLWCR